MKKLCILAFAPALFFFAGAGRSCAQALPTATSGGVLQVGGGVSNGNTDEEPKRISGISAYATFDFTAHLGLEADVHFLNVITPNDFAEESYLIGARYVYRKRRFEPYAKVLVGIGKTVAQEPYIANQVPGTPGTYGMFAFGGGLDIHFAHHLQVRAIDFEYQDWPGFQPNGLSPSIITVGAAYRFR